MKIIRKVTALPLFIILVCSPYLADAQVIVEKSREKIIISGVQYYNHQVKKGETAYSIARSYGITVEQLNSCNPDAAAGVKVGQYLRIPVVSASQEAGTVQPAVPAKKDESKYIYHKLNPGETVYFLSKTYGVTEEAIISSNAGIDITKLPVGAEIAIPRINAVQEPQVQEKPVKGPPDDKYYYHQVVAGESLSSISRQYGVSLRELRKANDDLRFPQVGQYVRIPGLQPVAPKVAAPVKADSVKPVAVESVVKMEPVTGFTPVSNLRGSLKVAVLLPFYLDENNKRVEVDSSQIVKGKRVVNVIYRDEEWIYPRSLDFIEMYEGILLAADTLRSLGLDIDLYPFDIKSDTEDLTSLIRSGKLNSMDLIIGPVYSHNLTIMAEYARNLNIPVVSPVQLMSNSPLSGNPTLFLATSSLEVAQSALAKKIGDYYDHNLIFVHTDSLGTDTESQNLKARIINELSYHIPADQVSLKEMLFQSMSVQGSYPGGRLPDLLSVKTGNVVVISSEDPPVISETIMDVHNLAKKYDIEVWGYPAMRDVENLEPKYFFDLGIKMFTPGWIDYRKDNVKCFNKQFRQKFLTEPVEKSYAWQGYDISYYFMSGLAMHGRKFIDTPAIHNPELLQSKFDFVRRSSNDGFENQKLFLIRYTPDYEVRLEE